MSDGGEGLRDGDADRGSEQPDERSVKGRSESGDGPVRVEDRDGLQGGSRGDGNRPAASERHGATAGGSTAETTSQQSTNQQRSPVLAEPTPMRIAQTQARTTDLEHGAVTEYTTEQRSLDSVVQIQWAIWTGIVAVVLGLIASGLLANFGIAPQFGTAFVGLFLGLGMVWVVLRYRAWAYQVREDSLYLERGVVTHIRTIVPYVRIQHVDTRRSALERALGLSTLVVYTAGSRGADVSIPGLKPKEARDMQQRLKELAIEAEGDDAL